MPDDTPTPPADSPNDPIPDGQAKPEAKSEGADTPPAKPEAKPTVDITTTPEFKAALTEAIKAKLPQLQRQARNAVARELSGVKDGEPATVESLTKERDEASKKYDDVQAKLRTYEAAEQVEEFIADKRNNVQVRNMRGLLRLIRPDYEFDDDGKVTNLKELIAEAKRDAPELFGAPASSVDAGAGGNGAVGASMNDLIRRAAGR